VLRVASGNRLSPRNGTRAFKGGRVREARPDEYISERASVAAAVARAAGKRMLERLRGGARLETSLKGPQDYVTAVDHEIEAFIRAQVSARFPHDTLLCEEGGGEVSRATWVVDPIDGTANFAHGVEHFAVSIGFVAEGKPALGVIYDPTTDLLFSAAAGAGAFLNGRRIKVSEVAKLDEASVEMGCWRRRPPAANYTGAIHRVLLAGASFRWAGSAALALADVARGASDAFYGLHLQPWDALAGIVIVAEAGGVVSDFLAEDGLRRGNELLASNAALFAPLRRIIAAPPSAS